MLRHVPPDRLQAPADASLGLTPAEVEERRARFGTNRIVAASASGWREVVAETARDPMIWFLAATSALFVWIGDLVEAAILAVALVPIAGMDAFLHRRTQASTEGLAGRLATRARVLRAGAEAEVGTEELVPGDIAIVPAGSYFPADGIILSGAGLQVDESALTGEAMPVRKVETALRPTAHGETAVATEHWGMAGTRLLTGEARIGVVFTGAETLYGEIARLAQTTHAETTPLQASIRRLMRGLVIAAILLCFALATVRYMQGHGLADALLSALTLAIAALPEEFPVVFSFFLGVGVYRLARHQALVRRAVVVENIGRVSCICTDKTGTLTEGRLAIGEVVPAVGMTASEVIGIAAGASRAETHDPLDLLLLETAGPSPAAVEAVFPFTEDRRRETVIHREADGGYRALVKGAPETVLAMTGLGAGEAARWRGEIEALAARGRKVIGVASLRAGAWTGEEPAGGYAFAGLLAFLDPVREGVPEAVREAQGAGIRVIMITGDHERTAGAIARQIGIGGESPRIIEGEAMTRGLATGESTSGIDVVARCIPSQKLELVRALQREGELVAVTGDGVNDAPALRGADIGIAMGEHGTRAAREVASIVLLDDNFATVIRAIREGRQLLENLKLSFAYLLMVHAPLVLTAAIVPLMGYPLLYLPLHIVWIELIMHPTALLVFQQLAPHDGLKPARTRLRSRFFSPREWLAIGLVGLLATTIIVYGFVFNLGAEMNVDHARSMAMAALVTASSAITASLSRMASRAAWYATALAMISLVVAIEFRPLADLLHLSPLHAIDWALALGGGILIGAGATIFTRRSLPRQGA